VGTNLKTLFACFSYFCTLPIIIIYFKIISVQQFEVQQLKYWESIPSVRTIMCNTSSKVLSENLFCLYSVSVCFAILCKTAAADRWQNTIMHP
jgi:hypothetical protein